MRMELEKQRIEMEYQREEQVVRQRRDVAVSQSSATIEVPTIHEAPSSSLEVPTDILQVRTVHSNTPTLYKPHPLGSYKAGQSYKLPRQRDSEETSP